jgi:GDSL-like Lipase/Acylhydrolase family
MLCRLALLLAFAIFAQAADSPLELTLPPRWNAVPGVPMSLYFDNIVLTEKPQDYRFEITCDIGTSEARRWTVTPEDKHIGNHQMSVVVKDAAGKIIEQGSTTLHVAKRDAGADKPLRLLIVGDSLTHATVYPNEIARLLSEPGNPQWTMLGTHKPTSAKPNVAHEGYGGWRWDTFLTKYDPAPKGVTAGPLARKSTSPFIFAGTDGKGAFDLPRYFKENCAGQAPDVVTFLLGINDCFGAKPDDRVAMDKTINSVLDSADKLLTAFHQAAPNAKLAVGLTTPPNSREEGFVANYKGTYHRWGWKRIQHRLVQRMVERLSHREGDGIYLVPTELNVDPIDGYPNNNGVHPNPVGYGQIGASFYSWIKSSLE